MWIDGLDEQDNKIIELLMEDARLSYSELGEQVGLSRVAVKSRMERLEQSGIIKGYRAVIDATSFAQGRRFYMDLVTEPDCYEQVVENLAKYDIIRKIYAVTGECRLKVEGFASSNMKYEMYMSSLKRNLDGIRSITIQDHQYTIKDVDGGILYDAAYGSKMDTV